MQFAAIILTDSTVRCCDAVDAVLVDEPEPVLDEERVPVEAVVPEPADPEVVAPALVDDGPALLESKRPVISTC